MPLFCMCGTRWPDGQPWINYKCVYCHSPNVSTETKNNDCDIKEKENGQGQQLQEEKAAVVVTLSNHGLPNGTATWKKSNRNGNCMFAAK